MQTRLRVALSATHARAEATVVITQHEGHGGWQASTALDGVAQISVGHTDEHGAIRSAVDWLRERMNLAAGENVNVSIVTEP